MKNTDDCKDAGKVRPQVDTSRCEGKQTCADVCPYSVFDVRRLTEHERSQLGFVARLKVAAHGGRQAFVVKPSECHACGLCVTACPEDAIKLVPIGMTR